MIVQQLRGRGQGLFKVTLTSSIEDVAPYKATFTGQAEDIEIPITVKPEPSSAYGGRKTGTLVTFVDASSGPLATVQNDTFDKAMAVFGTVVKPTQHQNHRGTNTLNGNRYCVVDTKEKVIPGSIMVLSPATQQKVTVHLRYKGQTWFCRRCEVNHVGPCSFLQAFYAAKDARSKQQIDLKVVSDSSLRLAEQVGLRADVLCMSGGGLGHLATVIRDDPMLEERKDIALVTGGNDIRQLVTLPPEDIVFAKDRSVAKVADEPNRHPDKHFTIINLIDDPRKPALRPDQALVAEYLE